MKAQVWSLVCALFLLPVSTHAQCRGVWSSMFDDWCDTNCLGTTVFCPAMFCDCTPEAPVSASALEEHEAGCCNLPIDVYFIELSNLYFFQVDPNTHEQLTQPVVCAQFLGPTDIEIDTNENVIVTDPSAGAVYMVEAGCGTVKVITDWRFDQIVDHPMAVALGNGGLYVSGQTRIFFLELSAEYDVLSHTQTDITIYGVDSMDTAPDGTLYVLERGAQITMYDPDTGITETFISVHQHGIPDMKGIKVTACGVYISITDSNQIYHCDDPTDGDSCEMLCIQDMDNLDSSSCIEFNNPYGLTVDCNCNVYTASRANGQVVVTTPDGTTMPIAPGLFHPNDVEIFAPRVCQPTPSNTPTRSLTPTSSRTASPTASVSASPSPTPSASVSASSTATSSPTSSPSTSSSPTPTATASPTATRTASRSRSPSPTPSPLWEQFLLILDFNTACSAGTCDGVNQTQINTYPVSSRAFSVQHSIRYHVASDTFSPLTSLYCDVQVQYTGTSLNYKCTRSVDPFAYIDFDPSVFQMFVALEDSGNGLPPYIIDIDRFPADTYPNALLKPAVSGLVNCVGYNDVSFRIAVQSPRPSWDDDVFGVLPMLDRGSLGPAPALTNYIDADGNNAEPLAPYKEFVCVQDV